MQLGHRVGSRALPVLTAMSLVLATPACRPADDAPTFARDVAPIVYERCARCHRPQGVAPFSLLSYSDVEGRARQIADVISTGYMPPWLPEPGDPGFVGERRLTDRERKTIRRWVDGGAPEGDPAERPAPPAWGGEWELGPPDVIVEMPETYTLPAEGFDVFRNFVIPTPAGATGWVKAVDLWSQSPSVVHHAIIGIDRTSASRRLDLQDEQPGFPGMELGAAEVPDGIFLGWTPGKTPFGGTDDVAWRLAPGTDLVVQLHMLPSGKPEPIRVRVGLYLAERPPTSHPSTIVLTNAEIDIPPGVSDYRIDDRFVLPVPVEVIGIYPHAHYVGKEILGLATTPDGARRTLIHIRDWDFNWQDEYRYVQPIALPAGTALSMHYTYDNSEQNERNPNFPPRRIVAGQRSTDEMGSLLIQVRTASAQERLLLEEAADRHFLTRAPDDPVAHTSLGRRLQARGRLEEALHHHRRAAELRPDHAISHHNLGLALSELGRTDQAIESYRRALQLAPDLAETHNNLGHVLLSLGRKHEARARFREALRLNPGLAMAHYNLGVASAADGDTQQAIAHYRRAVQADPGHALSHNNLGAIHHLQGELESAARHYRSALDADPQLPDAHNNLGYILAGRGDLEQAIVHYRAALEIRPSFAIAHNNLGAALSAIGRSEEARLHFREALRIEPGYEEARSNLQRLGSI